MTDEKTLRNLAQHSQQARRVISSISWFSSKAHMNRSAVNTSVRGRGEKGRKKVGKKMSADLPLCRLFSRKKDIKKKNTHEGKKKFQCLQSTGTETSWIRGKSGR